VQNAAMAYGDPAIMAQFGLGNIVNPNSALALAALKAQQTQQSDLARRVSQGTLGSTMAAQDIGNIASAQQRADLAGYQRYQNALSTYNLAMARAQNARDIATANARLDERQAAINQLPTAQTTAGGGFETGTTNVRARVPVGLQRAARAGKAPTLKAYRGTKPTKRLGGKASKGPRTPSVRPPKVKGAQKVAK